MWSASVRSMCLVVQRSMAVGCVRVANVHGEASPTSTCGSPALLAPRPTCATRSSGRPEHAHGHRIGHGTCHGPGSRLQPTRTASMRFDANVTTTDPRGSNQATHKHATTSLSAFPLSRSQPASLVSLSHTIAIRCTHVFRGFSTVSHRPQACGTPLRAGGPVRPTVARRRCAARAASPAPTAR